MRLKVNGEESDFAEKHTISSLISDRGLNPNMVVVEHNLVVVPREDWPQIILADGDELEIVTFMGGG